MKGKPDVWESSHRALIEGAGTPRTEQANQANNLFPLFCVSNLKLFCKKCLDVISYFSLHLAIPATRTPSSERQKKEGSQTFIANTKFLKKKI